MAATSVFPPAEVNVATFYTGLIAQSRFHLSTNSLADRLISRPGPSLGDILHLDNEIEACSQNLPAYYQHESSMIGLHSALLFSRHRHSWRVWNMKIMLLRPVLLRWSSKHRSGELNISSESQDELACRQKCLQYARETINSITIYMSMCIDSRLSTWYIL